MKVVEKVGEDEQDERDEMRAFCDEAARQMVGIEMRLRTLAAKRQEPTISLIEEAIGSSLQLAKSLLEAGREGRHGTLLTVRPLLRALSLDPR
jgi:hypothetical protein